MANPLAQFLTDRLITPAVQAQLPVQKDTEAYAAGGSVAPAPNLRDTLVHRSSIPMLIQERSHPHLTRTLCTAQLRNGALVVQRENGCARVAAVPRVLASGEEPPWLHLPPSPSI
jgi:hypothetical protein